MNWLWFFCKGIAIGLIGLIIILVLYVVIRLLSSAIFRSWFEIRDRFNNKEKKEEDKHE